MAIAAATLVAASAAAAPTATRIPLCAGLTIVTAVSQPEGDYESIKRIESLTDGVMRLKYSSEWPVRAGAQVTSTSKSRVTRIVPLGDLRDAASYLHIFQRGAPSKVPGTTAIGTSSAVLRELGARGQAALGIFTMVAGNVWDYRVEGQLMKVGSVSRPVLVNGTVVQLPTLHAAGDFEGERAEFHFLDDERNPLTLQFRIGIRGGSAGGAARSARDTLDVVRISYACADDSPDPTAAVPVGRIEQALLEGERIDIYDIFFSFNSAEIREESAPTLREIGDILRRHPQWRLAIGGHTDSIASDKYNLELSQRRAQAVKQALTTRERIEAGRLATSGHGESAPRETNETLEGRALNRRVELMRVP